MRTTLNIQDDLYREAVKATGVEEKTKLLHLGLQALVESAARRRLANLGGKVKGAKAPPRRKHFG